jgi:hypothetical protein
VKFARLLPLLLAACAAPAAGPAPFEGRGRLVCLAEELRERHAAAVPPVHEHVWALRLEPGPRHLLLLRTPPAEALFADEEFRRREVWIEGRVFGASGAVEVRSLGWFRDGARVEIVYWCEICSIVNFDPGPCECCQGAVERRERPPAAGGR